MQIKTKTQKKEEITKMRDYHHQSGGDGESDLIATLLASYGEWIEPNMDGSFLNSFSHFIIQYVDYAKHLTGYANQTTLVKVLMMKSVAFEAILFYMAHFDAGRRERILDSIYVLGKSQILIDEIRHVIENISQLGLTAKSKAILLARLMVETGREGMTHEKTLSLRLDHAVACCQRGLLDAALDKEVADRQPLTSALSQLRSIASGLRCYLSRVLLNDGNIRHAYPLLFEIVKEHN